MILNFLGAACWWGWMVVAILLSGGIIINAPYGHWFVALAFFFLGLNQFLDFLKKFAGIN